MKKKELFILGRSFGKTSRIKQLVEEISNRSPNDMVITFYSEKPLNRITEIAREDFPRFIEKPKKKNKTLTFDEWFILKQNPKSKKIILNSKSYMDYLKSQTTSPKANRSSLTAKS